MSLELDDDELEVILELASTIEDHTWLQPNERDLVAKVTAHLINKGNSNDD